MPDDVWDQFKDAPSAPAADPWAQFKDAEQVAQPSAPADTRHVGDLGSAIMEPLGAIGSSMLAAPVAGFAGIAGTLLPGPAGQGANWTEAVQDALTYQPRTQAGDVATKAISYPFAKLAQGADWLGQKASDATGSPAVGAAINAAAQFAPSLLLPLKGKLKPAEVRPNVARPAPADIPVAPGEGAAAAPKAAERPAGLAPVPKSEAPTLEQLKTDAKAAYKKAEDAGIKISADSFGKLKTKIVKDIGERVDPTLHPDTTAALKRVLSTKGELSLQKLDDLRQIASDAKGSVKPADQRLAAKIVDSIDEYVDGLSEKDITSGDPAGAAALKEARSLYTRQKKAEQIDELFRRAEIKAGANYTQSGLENALRGEFKALALNQKRMKRFTPEERSAIIKVAKGGKVENAFRFIGKFAPTGVISGVLTGGAGAMIGGPLGAALPLTGLAGRAVATRMTLKNANAAGELMRRGPSNSLQEPAVKKKPVNALLEY